MTRDDTLRAHVLYLLRGGNAHLSFDAAIAGFPVAAMNDRLPKLPYSPWALLEHLRIAQWDILEFTRNPDHQSPSWPDGYWPANDAVDDEAAWDRTVASFRTDLETVQALVAAPDADLLAPLHHAPDCTLLREALVLADHNAYHIGEFAVLRSVMGTWPADRDEAT